MQKISFPEISIAALLYCIVCMSTVHAQQSDTAAAEKKSIDAAYKIRKATVGIGPGNENYIYSTSGSGVIVSRDGLILTAAHVVDDFGVHHQVLMFDGKIKKVKLLGYSQKNDTAMLKIIDDGPWPYCQPGKSASAAIGDWCLACGHSDGIRENRPPPLRLGRLHSISIDHNGDRIAIATDCIIEPGDSGCGLFDLDGNVIGVCSEIGRDPRKNISAPVDVFLRDWDKYISGTVIDEFKTSPVYVWHANDAITTNCLWQSMRYAGILSRFSDISYPISRSIVEITAKDSSKPDHQSKRIALGIVVDDKGHIITKKSELTDGAQCRSNGTNFNFEVVAYDDGYDIALLKIESEKFRPPPVKWPSAKKLKLAQWIISPDTDGTPMALGLVAILTREIPQAPTYDPQQKPWMPEINSRHDLFSAAFTHDCIISAHSCGGPVITTSGDFAGMNIARTDRTAVYAIPPDILKRIVDKLFKKASKIQQLQP